MMDSHDTFATVSGRLAFRLGRSVGPIAALAIWMAVAPAAQAVETEQVTRGRRIAETACAPCHAVGRTGASPNAQAPLFRELGRKYPVDTLQEALAEGVVVGHPGMPQVKMTEGEIGDFLAYLASVQVP